MVPLLWHSNSCYICDNNTIVKLKTASGFSVAKIVCKLNAMGSSCDFFFTFVRIVHFCFGVYFCMITMCLVFSIHYN